MPPPTPSSSAHLTEVSINGHSLSIRYAADEDEVVGKYEICEKRNGHAVVNVWLNKTHLTRERTHRIHWTRPDGAPVRSFCTVTVRRGPRAKISLAMTGYMIREKFGSPLFSDWFCDKGTSFQSPPWPRMPHYDPELILGTISVSFYAIRKNVEPGVFKNNTNDFDPLSPTCFEQYLRTPGTAQLTVEFRFRSLPLDNKRSQLGSGGRELKMEYVDDTDLIERVPFSTADHIDLTMSDEEEDTKANIIPDGQSASWKDEEITTLQDTLQILEKRERELEKKLVSRQTLAKAKLKEQIRLKTDKVKKMEQMLS